MEVALHSLGAANNCRWDICAYAQVSCPKRRGIYFGRLIGLPALHESEAGLPLLA